MEPELLKIETEGWSNPRLPVLAARMAALPHPPFTPFGGKLDRYWAGEDAPDME